MTNFYAVSAFKRSELLTEALLRCSKADVDCIGELAIIEQKTPEQIWAEICEAKKVELCSIPELVIQGFGY
jgi:hypothetical protein